VKKIDLMGRRFGRLVVIAEADSERAPSGSLVRMVRVRCDCCGTERVVRVTHLRNGHTSGCGKKHGNARGGKQTVEYMSWVSMKQRCLNPAARQYKNYGARGITVCNRWLEGEDGKSGFECFLADMGPRPSPEYSIDRYPDNDGDYCSSNCRWATKAEQRRNQRT
jgi:hypothetical protein